MSDLVARFRAAADQDAAFEAAMRLVQESTEEIAKLRLEVARLERQSALIASDQRRIEMDVHKSSGNIFRDLGRPCADEKKEIARLRTLLAELVADLDSPGDAVSDELMARCRAAVGKG